MKRYEFLSDCIPYESPKMMVYDIDIEGSICIGSLTGPGGEDFGEGEGGDEDFWG